MSQTVEQSHTLMCAVQKLNEEEMFLRKIILFNRQSWHLVFEHLLFFLKQVFSPIIVENLFLMTPVRMELGFLFWNNSMEVESSVV